MQRVVFNSHYLAYCDDAVETWFRSVRLDVGSHGWDFMLKKAVVEWGGSAGLGDVLDIDVAVSRWGNSSFDVGFRGAVGERPVFTATITYVGVAHGTNQTMRVPDEVRALLS